MKNYLVRFNFNNLSRKPVIIRDSEGESVGFTRRFTNGITGAILEVVACINLTRHKITMLSNVRCFDQKGELSFESVAHKNWFTKQKWDCLKIKDGKEIRFTLYNRSTLNKVAFTNYEYSYEGIEFSLTYEKGNEKGRWVF